MTKKSKQNNSFVSQEEKDALLTSLKSTMHDLGRLPGLIFAPVIGYVSAHFAKIPEERRSHLKNILDEIKAGSSEGVEKLKGRFKGMLGDGEKTPAKKPAAKKAPAKKPVARKPAAKKPASWTDKVSDATKSVADKAKETTKKATTTVQETAKKTTAQARKTATKKTSAKKPVAKRTPAKKPAAKTTRTPAKKPAAKTTRTPATRTTTRTTPPKKK